MFAVIANVPVNVVTGVALCLLLLFLLLVLFLSSLLVGIALLVLLYLAPAFVRFVMSVGKVRRACVCLLTYIFVDSGFGHDLSLLCLLPIARSDRFGLGRAGVGFVCAFSFGPAIRR